MSLLFLTWLTIKLNHYKMKKFLHSIYVGLGVCAIPVADNAIHAAQTGQGFQMPSVLSLGVSIVGGAIVYALKNAIFGSSQQSLNDQAK